MLSCFFVVIIVFSMAFGIVRMMDLHQEEKLTLENLNIEFIDDAENIQRIISQIKYSLSELPVKFAADREFQDGTYLENDVLRADMRAVLVDRRQNEFSKYLSTAFIIDTEKRGYVYELTGTFTADMFFNQYYASELYTSEFWALQAISGDVFEVFPAHIFSTAREAKRVEVELLPVSYKPQDESRYIIVMMLDMSAMADDLGVSGIYSKSGEVLYASESMKLLGENELSSEGKIKNGYMFKFLDEQNGGIEIIKVISSSELNDAMGNSTIVPVLGYMLLVLLAGAFCVVVSLKYAASVRAVVGEISKNSNVKARFENGINNFDELHEGVKIVTSHDARGVIETNNKDSVLDSLFLQSRMRDVYVGIDDIEERVDISRSFFMIYFRVNYKQEFKNYIGKDSGRATFFLKQLIEMYFETWGIKATTFQIENNGIVSVLDTYEGFSGEKDVVDSIVAKLLNESEYAFFTVVVSNIYNGIENIKNVYDALMDLSKYCKPTVDTQVLYEGEVKRGASRLYFSVEEMGKLSAMLQNGTEEDVIRKVDEILDYNIKKDINSFELYLLCTEIINCAVKLVNRVFHSMPQSINLSDVYRKLERANTPFEYRGVCVRFLSEIMDYVRQNKREDDYIISYILDYVDNHYAEDIYLNLFAEKLKLTGAYISSYFKEKMNVNLSDYVNNYRIKRAVELSENPQNKNKDIAIMVGLPNINTFIRLFKKYTGYTPGEYRKKHFGDDYKK